jgi:hypothetical protein
MAAPGQTKLTTGSASLRGMREDLADFVNLITPEDTPFYSWCGSVTAYNDLAHDWQKITLREGAKNAQPEGNIFAATPVKRTTRLTNSCQIHTEVANVSRTSEVVRKAGRTSELDFQVMLKGYELRFDVEFSMLSNQVVKITDAREMAGIRTWAGTFSGGAGATAPNGAGTQAVVDGTARALDIDDLNKYMRDAWIKGARIDTLMMHPTQKLLFDELPTAANLAEVQDNVNKNNPEGVPLTTTVSIWRSAFGTVRLVMNRHMLESDILGLDSRPTVRPKKAPLVGSNFIRGKTEFNADGRSAAIVYEGTLQVPNPDAVILWAGLSTELNT